MQLPLYVLQCGNAFGTVRKVEDKMTCKYNSHCSDQVVHNLRKDVATNSNLIFVAVNNIITC